MTMFIITYSAIITYIQLLHSYITIILLYTYNYCVHYYIPQKKLYGTHDPLPQFQKFYSLILLLLLFSRSVMSDSLRPPWTAAHQAFLSFTISLSLLKLMSFDSVMPSNHLVLCHPLLLLPSIFPSIRVFSNDELALCIRWPNYWSFSFSISPSNEYLELISFRIDWFDLLAVQGTLKSLLQHHSSKASILRR